MVKKKNRPIRNIMRGSMFWGGLVARVGGEIAKRGGARVVAGQLAKKVARDQAEIQAKRGVFAGVEGLVKKRRAQIQAGRPAFVDDYTTLMNRARDRRDMKEYFRLARLADAERAAGRNPVRGVRRGGVVGRQYNNNLQW